MVEIEKDEVLLAHNESQQGPEVIWLASSCQASLPAATALTHGQLASGGYAFITGRLDSFNNQSLLIQAEVCLPCQNSLLGRNGWQTPIP